MNKQLFYIFLCLLFLNADISAQSFTDGFNYQAIFRELDGSPIRNSELVIVVGILEDSSQGNLSFEESYEVETDSKGWASIIVGTGTRTGAGTKNTLSELNWGEHVHYLNIKIDKIGDGLGLFEFEAQQLLAVPYAFYSKNSGSSLSLSGLTDIDLSSLKENETILWNGNNWQTGTIDSVGYADASNYAQSADSVAVAMNVWNLDGNNDVNSDDHFIGTNTSTDLVFKTADTERMRIKANGNVGIGTDDPKAALHIHGNNGFMFSGDTGGDIPASGPGTRFMWYPGKSALRMGHVNDDRWDDQFIGKYSLATGFNTRAKGDYSIACGEGSYSDGEAAAAFGWNSAALGEASFAAGSAARTEGFASVALGRNPVAFDTASMALGYHTKARGKASVAMGYESEANAAFAFATGWRARVNHKGSFMFVDYSNAFHFVESTAENQFFVRASGGFEFYTDTMMTTGVILEPGGGAWSTLSDKNKKENFSKVDRGEILNKIRKLDVSTWNYKSQDKSIRHIGPMAQDFYSAFQLGNSDKTITTTDIDGVNLVALKELERLTTDLEKKNAVIDDLENSISSIQNQKKELEKRLEKIESMMNEILEKNTTREKFSKK